VSFLFAFALGAVVFVAAPYLAHRLRRRRAEPRPFAPAHLVPPAPPRARRRAKLEDPALFAIRALAVLGLALLGASPFVHCSRLALSRANGASVALVVVLDDSMSMRALFGGATRFDRAKKGGAQLLASTREGDAVAIVLAGAPPRVALTPTTDLRAARAMLDGAAQSDRATDLDAALAMARGLLDGMPEADRRVVLLSDLADGKPDGAPLGEGATVPMWNALPEIRADGQDCGVIRADRGGAGVRVRIACTPGGGADGRSVAIQAGDKTLATAPAPAADTGEVVLALPPDLDPRLEAPGALVARLLGVDAIASDDVAPVVTEAAPGAIAVVDSIGEIAATGGPPVVEQALAALKLDATLRPLPQVPDRTEDLGAFVGIVVDDPPGFTPEERRALAAFVDRGGLVLLALGPRAARAPRGATREPVKGPPGAGGPTTSSGVAIESATGPLASSASSLLALGAKHRTILEGDDAAPYAPLLEWDDHQPLVLRRSMGRGEIWVVTLPFALDASDLPLRPAFLELLDAWSEAARLRTVPRRTDVGVAWKFPAGEDVKITGPTGTAVPVVADGHSAGAVPPLVGLYRLVTNGRTEARVVAPIAREVDLRPRRLSPSLATRAVGDSRASVDASPAIAVALLLLVTLELLLRLYAGRTTEPA